MNLQNSAPIIVSLDLSTDSFVVLIWYSMLVVRPQSTSLILKLSNAAVRVGGFSVI
jgi:hypothetical protein